MKRRDKFPSLRLKTVEKIPIRSPIAKFFNAPPSQVKLQPAGERRALIFDLENEPGPSNQKTDPHEEEKEGVPPAPRPRKPSDDDFEPIVETFRKPQSPDRPATGPSKAAKAKPKRKKQADIRKVLGINPELNYDEEEKLQRMLLQRSREENFMADDLQMALALSRSIKEQSGGGTTLDENQNPSSSRSRKNKKAAEFFEMLGMNQKKTKKGGGTATGSSRRGMPKSTLLTRRDENVETAKIETKIENIVSRKCSAEEGRHHSSASAPVPEFAISSCYLYDMRVQEKRVLRMNAVEEENVLHKFYVRSKLYPQSAIPAGHLLRDWAKIPGRSPSPETVRRKSLEPRREDALEMEIEKELEAINKQSEVFLQNYYRETNVSPDLFGDLSTGEISGVPGVEEEEQKEEEVNDQREKEEIADEKSERQEFPPVEEEEEEDRHAMSQISIIETFDTQQSANLFSEDPPQSPEMDVEIDLTQDSESEDKLVDVTYEVEVQKASQVTKSQETPSKETKAGASFDPDSIDAILARARSLIEDLNAGTDDKAASQPSPSASMEHDPPERTQSMENEPSPSQGVSVPQICIIESDEEEQQLVEQEEGHVSVKGDTTLAVSALNGLSKIDWSKDQFSIEIQSNHIEGASPLSLPDDDQDTEVMDMPASQQMDTEGEYNERSQELPLDYPGDPFPPSCDGPWDYNDMYNQQDCSQSQRPNTQSSSTSEIIDLCDQEEDNLVAMELEQIHFSQTLTSITENKSPQKSPKAPNSTHSPLAPSSTDIPTYQLIIRTDSVTPPPDFKTMSSEGIKVELQKYGIKTILPTIKAIQLLQHIYTQLHPLIAEDVDLEDLQQNPMNETVRHLEKKLGVKNVPVSTVPFTQQQSLQEKEKPKTSSRSKPKATCELPLELAFKNRLQFDAEYHRTVLHYKPIELKELMAFFKSIGCKYDSKDVIALLDHHCVTYRTVEPIKKATTTIEGEK